MAKKPTKKNAAKAANPKPPAKPLAKPQAKPATKPTTKPAKKASAKGSTPVAKKATKADSSPAAPNKTKPAAPKKKPEARAEATTDTSGRPAAKVHVHAGESAATEPRGRTRKETTGPTHGGITDAAVRKATGTGWAEWLDILDAAGAKALDHKAIAALLSEQHAVTDWWAQTLTVGYEQARGLRQKHEAPDGFQAGVSKTINAAASKLYKAWEDEATRERWMGEHKVEVRVANADKNIRMTWLVQGPDEGSSVEVYFWPKDANKCLVQVQQRKLADADAVQRVRAFWSVKLETLRAMMEKSS